MNRERHSRRLAFLAGMAFGAAYGFALGRGSHYGGRSPFRLPETWTALYCWRVWARRVRWSTAPEVS